MMRKDKMIDNENEVEKTLIIKCHNPNDNTTQHNLNTVVGLDMKMTVQTPPTTPPQKLKGGPQETQANIY